MDIRKVLLTVPLLLSGRETEPTVSEQEPLPADVRKCVMQRVEGKSWTLMCDDGLEPLYVEEVEG